MNAILRGLRDSLVRFGVNMIFPFFLPFHIGPVQHGIPGTNPDPFQSQINGCPPQIFVNRAIIRVAGTRGGNGHAGTPQRAGNICPGDIQDFDTGKRKCITPDIDRRALVADDPDLFGRRRLELEYQSFFLGRWTVIFFASLKKSVGNFGLG